MKECFRFAVNADCWLVTLFFECLARADSHEHGCLACAGVANDDNFVLLVKGLLRLEHLRERVVVSAGALLRVKLKLR